MHCWECCAFCCRVYKLLLAWLPRVYVNSSNWLSLHLVCIGLAPYSSWEGLWDLCRIVEKIWSLGVWSNRIRECVKYSNSVTFCSLKTTRKCRYAPTPEPWLPNCLYYNNACTFIFNYKQHFLSVKIKIIFENVLYILFVKFMCPHE